MFVNTFMFIVSLESLSDYKNVHNYPCCTDERTEAQRRGIPKDTKRRQGSPPPMTLSLVLGLLPPAHGAAGAAEMGRGTEEQKGGLEVSCLISV